ncbi:hypothetical protein GCM10018966_037460 [Streptomyces yanii]
MLAVAYIRLPYNAPSPLPVSSTATDIVESPVSGATAAASSASRSTCGSSLVTTGAVDDTEATGRGAASEGRPIGYMPPAAEAASSTTGVIPADNAEKRLFGIDRGMERTLGRAPGRGLWRT